MKTILRLFLLLLIAFGLARAFLTDDPPPPWEGIYLPGRTQVREWDGGARLVQSFEGVMGTVFVAELEGPDLRTLRRAEHALWLRVWELEQTLSTWIPDSLLSRVNRDAARESVSLDGATWHVLDTARSVWHATDGAFDPTVGPLLAVWKPLSVQKEMPADAEIERARALVGFDKVTVSGGKDPAVRFTVPGVALDVGGVAKGYAAEAAARAAIAAGATACRVNAGGDMYCAGAPRASPAGFAVSVRDPEGRPADTLAAFTILVKDRGVATSGNYERFTEIAGKRYSHILDPRTGRPVPNAITQVTVIAAGGAEADALATGLTVMGLERGMDFVRRTPGVEALFLIRKDGFVRHHVSPGFSRSLK